MQFTLVEKFFQAAMRRKKKLPRKPKRSTEKRGKLF
jgi:hypothetical protein